MGLAIRVVSALTDLDVPTPGANLYLRRNSGGTAYEWAAVTVPTLLSDLGGTLTIGAGGTGQTTALAAFNALSVLTTRGDLLTRDATNNIRLAIGASGRFLKSDGTDASWAALDHGVDLGGLGDDDHAQYALLAGRSGGQTLIGGTASGNGLVLTSTSHATKGTVDASSATQLILPVGTISLPGEAFTGDLNSGRYWISADKFADVVGGAALTTYSAASPNALIVSQGAAHVPLVVRGYASQSANLQQWQNSAGTVLAYLDPGGNLALTQLNSGFYMNAASGAHISMAAGSSLTFRDGASQTMATFNHNAGGTLRNAGTTRIEWNATGIGFFAATPVAKQAFIADPTGGATVDAEARTAITAVITALENYGLLATS